MTAPPTDRWGRAAVWTAVLAPAVIQPGAFDRFVLVSVLAVGVALGLGLRSVPTGRLPRWAVAGVAAAVVLLLVGAWTGAAPWAQFWGRWPRYEGLLTLPASIGALWLGARLFGPGSGPERRRDLQHATTVLVAAVGFIAVLEALGLRPLASSVSRPGSLLGNASDQGVIGVIAVAILLAPVVESVVSRGAAGGGARASAPRRGLDRPWVLPMALLAGALTVVLSGSRGALVALAVTLVTVAAGVLVTLRPSSAGAPRRTVLGWTAGALIAVVGMALALPGTAARVLGTSPVSAATVEGRALLWSETWRLIQDRPWTGVGPSGFVDAIPAYHTETWAIEVGAANPPDSPHSWLLQAGAVGGVPLMVLALALGVAGLAAGILRARSAATALETSRGDRTQRAFVHDHARRLALLLVSLGAVAGVATALAVHVTSPLTTAPTALLAGALIARPPSPPPLPVSRTRPQRWTGIAGLLLWLAVLVPAVAAEWPLQAAYSAVGGASAASATADAEADASFRLAQRLRPWDADIAMLAAHAFATRALAGDASAIEPTGRWADAALVRLPRSSTAIAAASAAAELSGDLERAETLMTSLVGAEPTNAEWLLRRGVIRAEEGDTSGAEEDFLASAERAPDTPEPWRNLGVLYRQSGDEERARVADDRAEELSG